MMKRLSAVLFFTSALAYGSEESPPTIHEVQLSSSQGAVSFSQGGTWLGLTGGYNYTVLPHWQLGLFPSVSVGFPTGDTGNYYLFSLAAGPTFNFSEDIPSSVFVRGTVGYLHSSYNGANDGTWALQGMLGKRFALTESITYSPSIGVAKDLRESSKPSLTLNVLALSAVF